MTRRDEKARGDGVWPRAVIFDLDGTLIDSAHDIATSVNDVLVRDGLEPFAHAQMNAFIGDDVSHLISRAYHARHETLAQNLADKVAIFHDVYRRRIAERTQLFPGAVRVLAALRGQGIKTAICTNKADKLARTILYNLKIAPLFDFVVGGYGSIAAKPAPDMIVETMRYLGTATTDTVMVGDSETDIATARAAGIPVVGVTFGYSKIPMRDLEPDVMIDRLDQALVALSTLGSHRPRPALFPRVRTAG